MAEPSPVATPDREKQLEDGAFANEKEAELGLGSIDCEFQDILTTMYQWQAKHCAGSW